jgi:DNA-binding transcriptional regulator GbsR (MarR family)
LEYIDVPMTIEELVEVTGESKNYIRKRVKELSDRELLRKQNLIDMSMGCGAVKHRRKDLFPGMPNVYVYKHGQEEMMADIIVFYMSSKEFIDDFSPGKKHALTSCLKNTLPYDLFEIVRSKY